jgi:16S rRNA processing protein RimM
MSSFHNNKSSNPDNEEPWDLLIGEVTAPHGLHGEMRIYPHTDFPERFADLPEVGLRRAGQLATRRVKVTKARVRERRIVLALEGIATIDDAEALRGTQLFIPRSWAVVLGDDEYYHHQLLGLEVITTAGESLGRITEIWPTGANDVYETPLALIPATKDMIREIDLAQGRMLVDARPGLKKQDSGE